MRIVLGFCLLGLCTGAFGITIDEVIFRLYTRTKSPQTVSNTDRSIKLLNFNIIRKTKFIIHGLDGKGTDPWVTTMTQAILSREDANVFVVDWSKGAILSAWDNCRPVGDFIEQFIRRLHTIAHAPYGDFHLIGHSLGAHVAGYAGDGIPGLGRITGLDPAALWFENNDPKDRLDPSDALFVEAIHTDIDTFGKGIRQPVGDVDYFPNGGGNQPGCFGCSHERVLDLFIESINSNCLFRSYPCNSSDAFKAGRCNTCGNGCANMGYNSQRPPDGTYYLSTNGQRPYCKG